MEIRKKTRKDPAILQEQLQAKNICDLLVAWLKASSHKAEEEGDTFFLGNFLCDYNLTRNLVEDLCRVSPDLKYMWDVAKTYQETWLHTKGTERYSDKQRDSILHAWHGEWYHVVPVERTAKVLEWIGEDIEIGKNGDTPSETVNRFKRFIEPN